MSQWPPGKVNLSGFGLEYVAHLGSGHYGCVQLVREVKTGERFCAKSISLAGLSEKEHENAHQEVCLLQALRHPLIVAYHNSFLVDGLHTLVILMEHCMGGDLRGLILQRLQASEHFFEDQVMAWFAQILLALQYIHSERVLHRDVKTSNIFLVEATPTSMVKLGDFGISRVLEGTSDAAMSTVGTPYYMSPEVCRNDPYNWKSDVWALGCVLYELCALKRAFESSSLAGLIYRIVNDKHDKLPDLYSESLCDLISQLLAKSTQSRPALSDLSAVPYVCRYVSELQASAPLVTINTAGNYSGSYSGLESCCDSPTYQSQLPLAPLAPIPSASASPNGSDWGSVPQPAMFGETSAERGFQTCSSSDFSNR